MAATTTAFETELVVAAAGVNERQQVAMGGTVTGGTFTLTSSGGTTAAIPWNATAAQVAAALGPTLGPGDIDVTGGPLPATAVVIDFVGSRGASDQPQITAASSLTGTAPTVTGTTMQVPTTRAFSQRDRGLMAGAAYRLRQLYGAGMTDPTAHTIAKSNAVQLEALTRCSKLVSFDAITAA